MSVSTFVLAVALFFVVGGLLVFSATSSAERRVYGNVWLSMFLGGAVVLLGFPFVYFASRLLGWPGAESFGGSYRAHVLFGACITGACMYIWYGIFCVCFVASEVVRLWKGPPYSLN